MQLFEINIFNKATHAICLHPRQISTLLFCPQDRKFKNGELQRMTKFCSFTVRKRLKSLQYLGLVEELPIKGYYQITESGIKRVNQFYAKYSELMKEGRDYISLWF